MSTRLGKGSSPTGPIFIGGAARSGKTLMRWILSAHPRIAISRRTELWARFDGRFGLLSDLGNLEACLDAMQAREQIARLQLDRERLRREFLGGPPTYGRLFALIHEHYAERLGKPRWGDQSPMIERFADRILAAYPNARIIHLIRDPRDRFEAFRATPGHPDIGSTTAAWVLSARLARRNGSRYPDRYLTVGYERLVRRPDDTVSEVCRFLGERFDPVMLALEGVERYRAERETSEDGSPISSAYVGRYRQGLGPCQIAFIQRAAGREMLERGYPLDQLRLPPSLRARCSRTWLLGYLGVGSWRMRSLADGDPFHRRVLGTA